MSGRDLFLERSTCKYAKELVYFDDILVLGICLLVHLFRNEFIKI